eukprot:6539358-Prymnesium_polylepis.1
MAAGCWPRLRRPVRRAAPHSGSALSPRARAPDLIVRGRLPKRAAQGRCGSLYCNTNETSAKRKAS